jgi:hypothetical protein
VPRYGRSPHPPATPARQEGLNLNGELDQRGGAVSGPIGDAVSRIPTIALECRRRRQHRWEPYTAEWDRAERLYVEVEECSRCTSKRSTYVSEEGYQVDRWAYDYVRGYLVAGGLPDDARAALRLETLRRRTRRAR